MSKEKKSKSKSSGINVHPTPEDFECDLAEEAVEVVDNGKIYQVSMDARIFSPKEVKIQISSTEVIIACVHETEEEISEMSEKMKIPQGISPDTIKCTMNKNGVLRIFAPYKPQGERDLPSTITSSSVKEVKIQTKQMDSVMEKKILEDKKFIDSTKDIQKTDGKLKMDVDMSGHEEKDIQVNVSERVVAIQAISSDTSQNRPKDIHKKYIIPDGVNPTSFRSFLKNKVLTVLMDEPKIKTTKPLPIQSQILEDNDKEIQKLQTEAQDITNTLKNENNKFEVKVNTSGYKAEELRIKVTKRTLIIHTHEQIKTKKTFVKKIMIPGGGTVQEAVANLLNPLNDTLTITGPILPEDTSKAEDISTVMTNISPGKFEVELDVSKFEQKEVEVKVLSNVVTIKAQKQTTKSSEGFFKKFNIPQGVKSQDIQYTFTSKKTLKIFTTETTSEKRETTTTKQLSNITAKIISGGLSSTSTVSTGAGATEKFEKKIECPGYKAEEIEVTIANGWITISGKQQLGPELNFQTRQFTKKFAIPYGIQPEKIMFALQPNGTLVFSNA